MAYKKSNPNGQAAMAASEPVVIANNQSAVPVSFIGSTDVATQTTLAAVNAKLVTGTDIGDVTINNSTGAAAVNIQDGGNAITVDGTVAVTNADMATVAGAVSATHMQADVLTLPANASVNNAQINGVTPLMGNGVTGTGSQRVTIASDNTAFPIKVASAGIASGAIASGAIASGAIASGAIASGAFASGAMSSVGVGTESSAVGANGVFNTGGTAVTAEKTATHNGDAVGFVADLVGKQIVMPYANPENFVSGATAAIVDTTNTSVIASAGGSLRNYITHILVTNSHATVGTVVEIRDGATTVLYRGYAASLGGGFSLTLNVPLRGTAATAVTASCITTGSNVYVSASGYKGI